LLSVQGFKGSKAQLADFNIQRSTMSRSTVNLLNLFETAC
jgi:hypothetical protein